MSRDHIPVHPTILEAHDIVGKEETSLIHQLPENLHEDIKRHVETHPHYFGVEEKELLRIFKESGYIPSATDHRLRINFWFEHDRAFAQLRKMQTSGIFHGVCARSYLVDKYMKSPQKVAWLLCPPASYAVKVSEALEFGLEQLREILAQPHVLPNGKFDSKIAEAKIKIVALLDIRVKGAVVQKNLNLNVSQRDGVMLTTLAQDNTVESLEKQLKELELRDRQAKNLPAPKEVIDSEYRRVESSDGEGTPS